MSPLPNITIAFIHPMIHTYHLSSIIYHLSSSSFLLSSLAYFIKSFIHQNPSKS